LNGIPFTITSFKNYEYTCSHTLDQKPKYATITFATLSIDKYRIVADV